MKQKYLSTLGLISSLKILLFVIISLLFTIQLSAQTHLLDNEIKLKANAVKIKDLLIQMEQQSGISFTYGNNIPLEDTISFPEVKQSIKQHLETIFEHKDVQFIERNQKILLFPKNKTDQRKPLQTLKGKITDLDSKVPLIGANIIISSEDFWKGTVTDINGNFRFDNIPVGRYQMEMSFVGYEHKKYPTVNLNSGKELVLNVELEESTVQLNEVLIKPNGNRLKPTNDIATLSSRSFSSLETENYPGALMDISRAAVSFPGVMSSNDGQNHIIIRGNSPKGLQWRLESIEIPNLNHFAEIGSSGGGIGIISNNMMGSSEFYTGAFPAEFGNALSGIFDLKMRTGNSDKHEQTFQIGVIGTEVFAEGPLNRKSGASYIAQYRYSTFELIKNVYPDLKSVPEFQDLSFKAHVPTKKFGTFSVFGIAGLSHESSTTDNYDWNSNMSTIGISNSYVINPKTYLKTIISFSNWKYNWDDLNNMGSVEFPIDQVVKYEVLEETNKISINLNKKINTRHKIKTGIVLGNVTFISQLGWFSDTLYNRATQLTHPYYNPEITYERRYSDDEGSAITAQAYINWKYRINNKISLNSGLHYFHFFLNDKNSLEPRIGLHWQFLPKHAFSAAYGLHSRRESLSLYTGQNLLHDGEYIQSNINLELTKARHYVIGYNYLITTDLLLKLEAYYQYIYNVPVHPFPDYFSSLTFDYGFEGNVLVNEGTGINKGIELTLEKYFNKGYYFMVNSSIYDSKYTDYRGFEFDTPYNGSFALNGIIQKEFSVGKDKQNQLGVNARFNYMGGLRHLPINLELSQLYGYQVTTHQFGYTDKADDYFRIDIQISFKKNKAKYSSEWRLDLINVTNHENMRYKYYNSGTQQLETEFQNPIIPMLAYKIMF